MVNDNIFLDNGYINIPAIDSYGCVFNLIIGGRGTGKTFSSIKFMLEENKNFIFMRKNQAQLDMVCKPGFTPFEPLNYELGYNIELKKQGRHVSLIQSANKNIGFMIALSAISGIRGFDASGIDVIIYDEFIHELHEKPLKGEFEAFANAYETVNRNRELKGIAPVKVYLLANSNSLDSDILLGLNLIEKIRKMRKNKKAIYIDQKRSLLVVDLFSSPISAAKKETALYKLTAGTDFYGMAVDNDFTHDNTSKVKSMPLVEYRLEIAVNDLFFYKHKNNKSYFISQQKRGTPRDEVDPTTKEGHKRLISRYGKYYKAHVNNKVIFESMTAKILFEKYFKG